MSSLVKMQIVGFTDEKFANKSGSSYKVMLNPESLKWDRSVEYNDQQAPDSADSSKKYRSTPAESLSFDLVLDCTGVIDQDRISLPKEMDALKTVVYEYNGKIHRPNFVAIHWGSNTTFQGVLTGFDTTYSLFAPNGDPLRAKISLRFSSYTDPVTAARAKKPESPDMTHIVDIAEGDTLPELAHRLLQRKDIYTKIAAYNGLNKFRKLDAGQRLEFPPLVNEASQ